MRFMLPTTAGLVLTLSTSALAQTPKGTNDVTSAPTPAVDVSRLPVNLTRIGRQLRQVQQREERDGLRLRYTVDVYGQLPKIQLITPLDNLLTGDAPRTAPTHTDMIRMMTPREFSTPVFGITLPGRK